MKTIKTAKQGIVFLVLLFFFMQSCKAQENNIKKDTMIYPIVTKDFEVFDELRCS
jgi:hypothetical protein